MSSRVKTYGFLIVFGIIVLGGVAAASFYGDELRVLAAGGWNKGAIQKTATDFVDRVQKKDYEGAMKLVSPSHYEPIRKDGKLHGMKKNDPSGLAPASHDFATMFPEGTPAVQRTEHTNADGGAWLVILRFPDGKESGFLLGSSGGAFQIRDFQG